jgi:hypothetical protein
MAQILLVLISVIGRCAIGTTTWPDAELFRRAIPWPNASDRIAGPVILPGRRSLPPKDTEARELSLTRYYRGLAFRVFCATSMGIAAAALRQTHNPD